MAKLIWTLHESLEQARAALPDASFATKDGLDLSLIPRINAALDSSASSDADLKILLIEAREALPLAWEKHGGCSEELLNAIDLAINLISEQDFQSIKKEIEKEIKKADSAAKNAGTLAEKIDAQRIVKGLREKLRKHKLSYFDFV